MRQRATVSIVEAAAHLCISRQAVHKAIAAGRLRVVRVGGEKRIRAADLAAYVPRGKGQQTRTGKETPAAVRASTEASEGHGGALSQSDEPGEAGTFGGDRSSGQSPVTLSERLPEGIRVAECIVSDRRGQGRGYCVVGMRYNERAEPQGFAILREGMTEQEAIAELARMQSGE
jgi:excisionase family DNA binding protein